jgi:hypothetical protein
MRLGNTNAFSFATPEADVGVKISSSNMMMGQANYWTNQGVMRSELVIGSNIKRELLTIEQIVITDLETISPNNWRIAFERLPSLLNITINTFIKIESIVFNVTKKQSKTTFEITPIAWLGGSHLPFVRGSIVDVQVLAEVSNAELPSDVIVTAIDVTSILSHHDKCTITGVFQDIADARNLRHNRHYMLNERMCVISQIQFDIDTMQISNLVLKTVDGLEFQQVHVFGATIALTLLDVIRPPTFLDDNVIVSTVTSSEFPSNALQFHNTRIPVIVPHTKNIMCIKEITIEDVLTYTISTCDVYADSVVAQLDSSSAMYNVKTIKGTASYSLIGMPLIIKQTVKSTVAGTEFIVAAMAADVEKSLNAYKSESLYFTGLDAYATLVSSSRTTLSIKWTVAPIVPIPDEYVVFILPFKESKVTLLSKYNNCYINTSLTIGTKVGSETLSVYGDASVHNKLTIYDSKSYRPFLISYDSNVLRMHDAIDMNDDNIVLQKRATINGTVTAEQYLSFSDRRIKHQIRPASAANDMDTLKKINVKNFLLRDGNVPQKGVIAQELETILPDIVHEHDGYIPSICRNVHVTSTGALNISHLENAVKADIVAGGLLRITHMGKVMDARIKHVHEKRGALFIRLDKRFRTGDPVYIHGPYGKCKVIDKEYLFMTVLSALKHVDARVDALTREVVGLHPPTSL